MVCTLFTRLMTVPSTCEDSLFLFGALVFAKFAITWSWMILHAIYKNFLRPRKNLAKCGKWAVVTGASDGIGKNYALELAKSKMNVVLVARREDMLKELAEAISAKYGVETKIVKADLGLEAGLKAVEDAISGLDIGVLVNNAGISYDYPDYFDNLTDDRIDILIKLNITALTKICKMVIGGMAERKRGAIVNISSVSGTAPMGMLAVYSASKSYVNYFSQALHQEYESKGVTVQSVAPMFVASAMSKQRPSLTVPKPSDYAKSAVNKIGYENYTEGYYIHSIIGFILGLLPTQLVESKLFGMHVSIRKRAMRKAARKAEEAAKAK